jgi:hypothetical protein
MRLPATQGFLNRWLVFNAGRGATRMVVPKYNSLDIPQFLRTGLWQVTGIRPDRENEPMRVFDVLNDKVVRDFARVGWSSEVEQRWYDYDAKIRGMDSDADREFWIRVPEHVQKLASIEAVYNTIPGSVPMIDNWGFDWAVGIAEASIRFLQGGMLRWSLEELSKQEVADRVSRNNRR